MSKITDGFLHEYLKTCPEDPKRVLLDPKDNQKLTEIRAGLIRDNFTNIRPLDPSYKKIFLQHQSPNRLETSYNIKERLKKGSVRSNYVYNHMSFTINGNKRQDLLAEFTKIKREISALICRVQKTDSDIQRYFSQVDNTSPLVPTPTRRTRGKILKPAGSNDNMRLLRKYTLNVLNSTSQVLV